MFSCEFSYRILRYILEHLFYRTAVTASTFRLYLFTWCFPWSIILISFSCYFLIYRFSWDVTAQKSYVFRRAAFSKHLSSSLCLLHWKFHYLPHIIKLDSHIPKKKLFYLLQWKPFKNDEKWFLFHVQSCSSS